MRGLLWVLPALALLTACGGDEPAALAEQPGCSTAPECGSCATCYETCVCGGKSTSSCVTECATSSGGAGGSGGGAAGTGSVGGAGGTPPVTKTVTLETTPRIVAPGDEAFFCQTFSNPFGADPSPTRAAIRTRRRAS